MAAGTTTVGALILELRANSAQFRAEMDAAGKATKNIGGHAALSAQSMARFGAIAAEHVAPGLEGSRVAMEGLIQAGIKAQGTLALVARGGLLVAAALGSYAIGNALSTFRELSHEGMGFVDALKLAVGMTKSFEERLKEMAEEEKAFIDQIGTAQALRLQFAKKAIQADTDAAAAGRQLADDELGAAKATLDGKLAILEIEKTESIKSILDQARAQKITAEAKREFLMKIETQYIKDRNAAYLKGSLEIDKIEKDAARKRVETWKDETGAFIDQLKARVQARQQWESQLGQGGLGGGIGAGLGEVRDLRNKIAKDALDLAVLEREGMGQTDVSNEREGIRSRAIEEANRLRATYAAYPAVLEAIDKAVTNIEFGNLGIEMAKARLEAARTVPTLDSLTGGLGQVAGALANIPPGADPATKAVQALYMAFNELQRQVYGAVGAIQAYEDQVGGGGGGAPAAAAPVSRAAVPNTGAQDASDTE